MIDAHASIGRMAAVVLLAVRKLQQEIADGQLEQAEETTDLIHGMIRAMQQLTQLAE